MAGKIELMIDIVSPFAYLAFHVLRHSPMFANVEVTYTPVLLGGILKAIGSAPPISIKNKRAYLVKERVRWSRLFNVPMVEQIPSGFPWNTTQIQRALLAVLLIQPEGIADVIEKLYYLAWSEGEDVSDPQKYEIVFSAAFGEVRAKEIFEMAKTAEIKQGLISNGQKAIDSGCFGLPWFIVTNTKDETDTFWGFDHLGQVADFLGLDRVQAMDGLAQAWKAAL